MSSFATGLCDCTSDCDGCLDIVFCWPCQISRQCNALDGNINTCSCCMCILSLLVGPAIMACCIRRKTVEKFSMSESGCAACFIGFFCPSCSLCQTHRELTTRNAWPGGTCCQSAPPSSPMS